MRELETLLRRYVSCSPAVSDLAKQLQLDENQHRYVIEQVLIQRRIVEQVVEENKLKLAHLTAQDLLEFESLVGEAERLGMAKAKDHKLQVKIERAPGFALYGFLSTICSKKFVERELSALLADGNVQYQELLASGDIAGARRWKWSMRVAMVSTVFRGGLCALLGLVRFKAQSSE